jgi:hypothetical protein
MLINKSKYLIINYFKFVLILFFAAINTGCAFYNTMPSSMLPTKNQNDFGVLLMAHGGSQEWNKQVSMAVKPLQEKYRIEVAFGMADAAGIQKSVQKLETHGAKKIGVVRLFISGESWYSRTEQILGIRPGAPVAPALTNETYSKKHDSRHQMQFWKIKTAASCALSEKGLVESPAMGAVLADRVRNLMRDPQKEDVLILAHGLKDDLSNDRLLDSLDLLADQIRASIPFQNVKSETLREDWPEKSKEARSRIRAFFQQANEGNRTVIVLPFRVYGFGPYAEVLEEFNYISDGKGLIPHSKVTEWVSNQIELLKEGPFRMPLH